MPVISPGSAPLVCLAGGVVHSEAVPIVDGCDLRFIEGEGLRGSDGKNREKGVLDEIHMGNIPQCVDTERPTP